MHWKAILISFIFIATILLTVILNIFRYTDSKMATSILFDEQYYKSLLMDISDSKERIDIAMYLFYTSDIRGKESRSNNIERALCYAVTRGLEVNIVFGAYKETNSDLYKSNNDTARELISCGVNVRFSESEKTIHTKIIVIDGQIVYVGSHNITDAALGYNREATTRLVSEKKAYEVLEYIDSLR